MPFLVSVRRLYLIFKPLRSPVEFTGLIDTCNRGPRIVKLESLCSTTIRTNEHSTCYLIHLASRSYLYVYHSQMYSRKYLLAVKRETYLYTMHSRCTTTA